MVCFGGRMAQYIDKNARSMRIITTWRVLTVMLFWVQPLAAEEGYRFFYNFAPGVLFYEMDHSRQESGTKLISEFHRTVEFRVAQARDAAMPKLSARIIEPSNKGRRIN